MWSETNQQLVQLAADLLGPEALTDRHAAGATSCCARAATRSRAAPPRSSRTSSPSACSACRGCGREETQHELRLHRRPARDQAHRARAAGQPLDARARARGRRGRALRRRAVARAGRAGLARHRDRRGARRARASAPSSWRSCSRSSATPCAVTPFLGTALAGLRDRARPARRAARALAARAGRAASCAARSAPRAAGRRARRRRRDGRRARARRGRRRRAARATAAPRPASSRSTAIDPTRRYARVRRDRAPASRCRATSPPASTARRSRVAAELVGVCQRALEMTRRLRQGPQAVRHAGRRLPGGLAPLRADAARHRGRALGDVLRRLGGRRRARAAGRGGRRWPRPPRRTPGAR